MSCGSSTTRGRSSAATRAAPPLGRGAPAPPPPARREAEQRVRDAEQTYRTLVEQLPVAVYQDAIDEASTAVYLSPQYERLFGYTVEERLADPGVWGGPLHPDDRERITAESDRTNETGERFVEEYRFLTRDGTYRWVRDEAVLLRE